MVMTHDEDDYDEEDPCDGCVIAQNSVDTSDFVAQITWPTSLQSLDHCCLISFFVNLQILIVSWDTSPVSSFLLLACSGLFLNFSPAISSTFQPLTPVFVAA